jgi:hypothetical protein
MLCVVLDRIQTFLDGPNPSEQCEGGHKIQLLLYESFMEVMLSSILAADKYCCMNKGIRIETLYRKTYYQGMIVSCCQTFSLPLW